MRHHRRLSYVAVSLGFGLFLADVRNVRADAQAPLDPNAFASLGSIGNQTLAFHFDTGDGTSTPVALGVNPVPMNGVIFNGIAVFDFTNISLPNGSSITASGSLPLAILSRGDVSIQGTINVAANGTTPGPGGSSPLLPSPTPPGPGAGGPSGGGGFGGIGGGSTGGVAYGDPTHVFFGGSNGGSGGIATGGSGGGGFELSAVGDISVGGSSNSGIFDDGGAGQNSSNSAGGGGGSGGGIFLATPGQISVTATAILATGGSGGNGTVAAGGGGGGGRILFETSNYLASEAIVDSIGGSGGSAIATVGADGGNGTFDVTSYVPAVPEPEIGAAFWLGAPAMLLRRRGKTRTNSV